jgi:hypothetical protein
VSAAIRIVHAIASSQPPPRAKPLTAAITGFPSRSIRSNSAWPCRACSRPATGVCTASSLMSAPATNDFSPPPVRTMARTSASSRAAAISRSSSASVAAFSALSTFGRLIVIVRTPPSRSTSRFS